MGTETLFHLQEEVTGEHVHCKRKCCFFFSPEEMICCRRSTLTFDSVSRRRAVPIVLEEKTSNSPRLLCAVFNCACVCSLSLSSLKRERERKKKKEKETPELSLTLWGFRSSTCVYRNQVIFSSHVKPLLCFSFLLLFFSPFNFAFFPSAFCVHRSRDFFFSSFLSFASLVCYLFLSANFLESGSNVHEAGVSFASLDESWHHHLLNCLRAFLFRTRSRMLSA